MKTAAPNYVKERFEKMRVKYILHDHSDEYGGNTPVIIAKLEKILQIMKNLEPISLLLILTLSNCQKILDVYVKTGLLRREQKQRWEEMTRAALRVYWKHLKLD